MDIKNIISFVQLIIAVILIALVLLQERGSGMGEAIGGASQGGFTNQRRGVEKYIFMGTVIGLVLFVATSLALLII